MLLKGVCEKKGICNDNGKCFRLENYPYYKCNCSDTFIGMNCGKGIQVA